MHENRANQPQRNVSSILVRWIADPHQNPSLSLCSWKHLLRTDVSKAKREICPKTRTCVFVEHCFFFHLEHTQPNKSNNNCERDQDNQIGIGSKSALLTNDGGGEVDVCICMSQSSFVKVTAVTRTSENQTSNWITLKRSLTFALWAGRYIPDSALSACHLHRRGFQPLSRRGHLEILLARLRGQRCLTPE